MENIYKLKNIIKNLTTSIKKQDFLVYFRKMSIIEIVDNKIVFGVESGFMKNNLEAKFLWEILLASQKEDSDIVWVELMVDDNIDVPSNTKVVDCTKYYKEATKISKTSSKGKLSTGPETKKELWMKDIHLINLW